MHMLIRIHRCIAHHCPANTNRASEDGGLQSIEVVCVHPPGRGSRQSEDPVRDMGAYVTAVCDAMALYFDRPFG